MVGLEVDGHPGDDGGVEGVDAAAAEEHGEEAGAGTGCADGDEVAGDDGDGEEDQEYAALAELVGVVGDDDEDDAAEGVDGDGEVVGLEGVVSAKVSLGSDILFC